MKKCATCHKEFEGAGEICPACVAAAAGGDRQASKCPECGCEFDGNSITHASDKLTALTEETETLKSELAAAKTKIAELQAAPAPPAPAPVEEFETRRRLIHRPKKVRKDRAA